MPSASCSSQNLLAARYTHLLRLIESTRDFEDQQQLDTADGLKATLLSNLALVAFQQEEYARSIEWCDKALNMDPENAKVRVGTIKGDGVCSWLGHCAV
jgi:tetratricopeptide (TPR) repeat protein